MIDEDLNDLKRLLEKYHQEHLIYFYDELDIEEKRCLLDQIQHTDFEFLKKIYEESYHESVIETQRISPQPFFSKSKLDKTIKQIYASIGTELIKQEKVAVLTLAGGMGSRLGCKGPKGCYELDIPPKKSLFELISEQLKKVLEQYHVSLPWYIMTSPSNHQKTRDFFQKHDYFSYPKEKIYFFVQDVIPILDVDGKVMLENEFTLKQDSNGNGDVFRSFCNNHLQETLEKIEWISIAGVDNIILELIDPLLLGIASYHQSPIAAKSIRKKDPAGKEWVFAKVDGKPSIIDAKYLNKSMTETEEYRQMNILAHLFQKDAFLRSAEINLPYHRAYKKNDFVNEEGMKIVAKEPNSFKFEKFIFDVFPYFQKLMLLEVEEEMEFSPIKSFTGEATPETALEKYLKKKQRQEKR